MALLEKREAMLQEEVASFKVALETKTEAAEAACRVSRRPLHEHAYLCSLGFGVLYEGLRALR